MKDYFRWEDAETDKEKDKKKESKPAVKLQETNEGTIKPSHVTIYQTYD